MRGAARLLLVCALCASSSTLADAAERSLWSSQEEAQSLSVDGWLATDLRAFRRTETGYGASWNVEPVLNSARLALRYRFQDVFTVRLDGEFAEANPDVQEAWLEYSPIQFLALRAGRVKVPFGLSPQQSVPEYDLLSAPMVFGNAKDFRDVGFMISGDWAEGFLTYAVAAVTGSRDLSVDVNDKPDVVGRLVLHMPEGSCPWVRGIQLGGSASWGEGPTRHGFRGRTLGGHTFSDPPVVRGNQLKWGAEFLWQNPLFKVSGEYVAINQDRDGITESQKVGTAFVQVGELEPYVVTGYYAEATAYLTRMFGWDQDQFSAVELTGRFERLDFGDGTREVALDTGTEQRAPLLDSGLTGVGVALHVRPARQVRITLAWQGLLFDDAEMEPDFEKPQADSDPAASAPSPSWVHSLFLRAQFEL